MHFRKMDRRDFRKVNNGTALSNAVMKVERYAGQDQNSNRVDAKKAILHELGADLSVRAERIRLGSRNANEDFTIQNTTQVIRVKENAETIRTQNIKDVSSSPSRIPVSQARLRHREKKERGYQPRQAKSNIRIQDYRPDYHWNRGGRVKELRIRCLARKFLHIWIRKVYGRVTLSKAKDHFNKQIVKRTFAVWHELWWELRKEWRLQVRAECHHRYILWSLVFRVWMEYVHSQRAKKAQFFKAQKHYVLHTERVIVSAWVQFVHARRAQHQLVKQADTFNKMTTLRSVWRQWQVQMALGEERREMETIALQFWAYRLQAQHWLLWHAAYQRRLSERKKLVHADRHQYSMLLSRCFKAWVLYHKRRQEKLKHKYYAQQVHASVLKARYLQVWWRHLSLRRSLARHQEHMQDLSYRFTLRRSLQHWKLYVTLQREEADKERKADNYYRTHLLSVGVSAFRLYVVSQRIQVMRGKMADQLRTRQLCGRMWRQWLARCESSEELKMMPQTRTARKHHRKVMLRQCFQSLQQYAQWRRYRKSEYSRADAHHYLRVMPQCIFRLRVFVQLEKNIRENKEKAEEFRRESLHVRYFMAWQKQLKQSRENRMLERMSILHDEDVRRHKFFLLWRSRTADRLEELGKLDKAGEHYCVTLCLRHLRAWNTHVQGIKRRELDEVKAVRHRYVRVLKTVFTRWKTYYGHRKEMDGLKQKAIHHLERRSLQTMVSHWKLYVSQARDIRAAVETRYKEKCSLHLRWGMCVWRNSVREQRGERQRETEACVHHNRHLLVKVLTTWHRYAVIHAYKKSETKHLEQEARSELNKNKLRRCFRKWHEARESALIGRLKWEQAVQHDNTNVIKDAFACWREYSKLQTRKTLLERQSVWFLRVRLTARYFLEWRGQLAQAEVTKQKTGLALWHWSLVLLKKCMVSWFLYSRERRRKKGRVAEAMEGRRLCLLREGAAQWMRVANDLAEMRGRFAAQQQAKSMFNTFQTVQKCALHWRYWAAKQKDKRGGPKPLEPPKQPHSGSKHPVANPLGTHTNTHQPYLGTAPPKGYAPYTENLSLPLRVLPQDVVLPVLRHAVSPSRPAARLEIGQGDGPLPAARRERARPRKPAFLIESLKRAGLYASVYETSDSSQQGAGTIDQTVLPSGPETDALSLAQQNESIQQHSQETTRPTLHHPPGAVPYPEATGTENTPPPPLHLSNTSDTEFIPPSHFISPSCSTQRSQPSGNPLHYSSPIAEDGRHRKHQPSVTWKPSNNIISGNLDNKHSPKHCLLTPDDFLKGSNGSEFSTSNPRGRHFSTQKELDSSTDTLLPSYRNGHRDLKKMSEMYLDLSTVRSEFKDSISPADEIVLIRDRLKSFDAKKKRLRRLTKQHKQLSDWLADQEVKVQSEDDVDVLSARDELMDLGREMSELRVSVEREKCQCQGLVERARELVQQLETVAQ